MTTDSILETPYSQAREQVRLITQIKIVALRQVLGIWPDVPVR